MTNISHPSLSSVSLEILRTISDFEMENFSQEPLAINVSSGADSSHKNHLLENMGEVSHALPSPNPFDQAGVSSIGMGEIVPALSPLHSFAAVSPTGLDEIVHALLSPNPFDQAGVLSTGLGDIAHALPSPNPFDQGRGYSHSLERENAIDGGVIQVEGSCRCFSLDVVKKATNDFDDALVVGTGGFGKVYKGSINDGATTTIVAIKRLNAESNQGAEEFWTEVKLLSKFHHTNLVSLIGYCNEKHEMILVYEYIAHGTLASHLYKSRREESGKSISHLKWAQRLNICLSAARGLDYLHNGTKQRIIHRDVKTTNILLDENLVAKVSDFGICKLITSQTTTHVSTKVKATRGYWDPEYFITGQVTRKSDVYAFGVVLLEVLCGRPPLDDRLEEEQSSLILWAKEHIENGKLDRIIDPSLNKEIITPRSLKYFAELAINCLHTKPKERPTMFEVVEILQNALALHEHIGRSWGLITKALQGIKLVAMGMNRWWREGKSNSSNDSGGLSKQSFPEPIFESQKWVYPQISLGEIRAATNDFNKGLLITQDSWYRLNKGYFVGGTPVIAIKRFKSRQCLKEYTAEIQVHSLTRHPNIVSLIGFCSEKHELILVYDYKGNGTLKTHLHEKPSPLNWEKRLEICIDIAQGLKYLHTNVEQQFIHCDIKPSNVLLDDKSVAKIAGFDIALPIPTSLATEGVETSVRGTVGYLDPEYQHNCKVTKKTDVYAFGVMLLEVLCAKTPFSPNQNMGEVLLPCWFQREKIDEVIDPYLIDEDCLLRWFHGCIARGTIDEVIDPYLIGKVAPECFRHYVNIALSCVVKKGIQRPSMNDVLGSLQSSFQMQEAWKNSVQIHMADVPGSYDDVISVKSKFSIGGQNYLISDLVRPWSATSLSGSGYSSSSE